MCPNTIVWYIIGLGNPPPYIGTRHNIGKDAVQHLCDIYADKEVEKQGLTRLQRGNIEKNSVCFAVSDGYMNESGKDLTHVLQTYHLNRTTPDDPPLILIHDDIDIPFGSMRFSYKRGDGGHKGVVSIIETLGSLDIVRLRVGIGIPKKEHIEKFVINPFVEDEKKTIQDIISKYIPRSMKTLVQKGYNAVANEWNGVCL